MTTTEFCDLVAGGVLVAVPERLESAGRRGLPQVVSLGALDMVNFGPLDTVPEQYRDRNLYVHNPTITLMRTTPGGVPGDRAHHGREAERGDRADGAVHSPARGLRDRDRGAGRSTTPRRTTRCSRRSARRSTPSKVELHEVDADVNDPSFALAMANRLHELIEAAS